MEIILKKKSINKFLINIFIMLCVVFPGDIYSLKKITFFIICLTNFRLMFNSIFNKKNGLLTIYGFIFPTLLFFYSTIMTGNILESFSRSFAPYMFLLIFIIKHYNLDYETMLLKAVKLIMITTISLALLDIIGVIDVNSGFFRNNIMYGYGLGLMGKSPSYPFVYKIFFRTSPMLVILFFKRFNESKYFSSLLTIIALIISGTRANVLFPVIFLIVFYIFGNQNKSKFIKYALIGNSIVFFILSLRSIIEKFNEIFIVKGQVSDIVRRGHIEGILELLKNDPWIIFKGSGMGSKFYSYGIDAYTSSIEWSYIDLWRQMGFFFFFLFLVFILIPLFYSYKDSAYKKYAYCTYLCIAATNPLLFSSTSYLVYIYMYFDLKKINKDYF